MPIQWFWESHKGDQENILLQPMDKPLLGLKALAGHCGVSENALRKWIEKEAFPAAKDPCWMTTTAKIAEWVEGKVAGVELSGA
jgi:hypothetical protein